MKRYLVIGVITVIASLAFSPAASAQAGHFVGTPTCTDEGTFLECTGKVAGLGGTTFRIDASAPARAVYACQNRGGNFPADPKKQEVSEPATGDTVRWAAGIAHWIGGNVDTTMLARTYRHRLRPSADAAVEVMGTLFGAVERT